MNQAGKGRQPIINDKAAVMIQGDWEPAVMSAPLNIIFGSRKNYTHEIKMDGFSMMHAQFQRCCISNSDIGRNTNAKNEGLSLDVHSTKWTCPQQ